MTSCLARLARAFALSATLAASLLSTSAMAAWPEHPIKLIWPYAAGGLGYNLSRLVVDGLSERLGQPVIIDVRPGAGGTLGAGVLKGSPNDGYTIMMGTIAPLSLAPGLYKTLAYDPVKDFEPIAMTFVGPNIIVVNAASPIKTFAELVAYAKANPGKMTFGTAGNGSTFQLTAGLFSQLTNGQMVNVPYKGGAPAFMALLANEVSVVFGNTDSLPHVAAGKLRALAVMSPRRLGFAPNIPTTAELGMPELMLESWYGLVAPAGTPREIIERLNRETAAVLASPKVQEQLRTLNTEVARDTSAAYLGKTIATEIARWRPVIQSAGITPD
jgi:tripartite-type tricarboxylate transporter receptor subunit TctC